MTEITSRLAPDEPDPPYVDDSPPAAPDEVETEPEFQPRNDVVNETDPDSETAGGTSPHTEDTT